MTNIPPAQAVLLTERHVAEILGLSVATIRRWRQKGRGPQYLKLERGTVRYRSVDVCSWIDSSAKQDQRDSTARQGGVE